MSAQRCWRSIPVPPCEACLDYAKREQKQNGGSAKDIVFERDQSLLIERYTRKLGSQFVSSILTGNGAVVYDGAPSAELSFICLLADDKQAVFFALAAAPRCAGGDAMHPRPRDAEERPPMPRPPAARRRGGPHRSVRTPLPGGDTSAARPPSPPSASRTTSGSRYRDAECARRRDFAPAGVSPDDYAVACSVELIRRRALDMR